MTVLDSRIGESVVAEAEDEPLEPLESRDVDEEIDQD